MNTNHTSLKLITPPESEPVSLSLAKSHARIYTSADDDLISLYISAARRYCENETGRALITQTWRYSLDRFPLLPNTQYAPGNPNVVAPAVNNLWPLDPSLWAIFIPRSPLIEVTSLTYLAVSGERLTMDPDAYMIDADSEPARLATPAGSFWPGTMFTPGAVQITFTAGYTSQALIPQEILLAMLLLVSHWYEHREAVWAGPGTPIEVPIAVKSLLASSTVTWIWA